MKQTLAIIEQLHISGVIGPYAIGVGAIRVRQQFLTASRRGLTASRKGLV